jgi:hypothetical protein
METSFMRNKYYVRLEAHMRTARFDLAHRLK